MKMKDFIYDLALCMQKHLPPAKIKIVVEFRNLKKRIIPKTILGSL